MIRLMIIVYRGDTARRTYDGAEQLCTPFLGVSCPGLFGECGLGLEIDHKIVLFAPLADQFPLVQGWRALQVANELTTVTADCLRGCWLGVVPARPDGDEDRFCELAAEHTEDFYERCHQLMDEYPPEAYLQAVLGSDAGFIIDGTELAMESLLGFHSELLYGRIQVAQEQLAARIRLGAVISAPVDPAESLQVFFAEIGIDHLVNPESLIDTEPEAIPLDELDMYIRHQGYDQFRHESRLDFLKLRRRANAQSNELFPPQVGNWRGTFVFEGAYYWNGAYMVHVSNARTGLSNFMTVPELRRTIGRIPRRPEKRRLLPT